MLEPEAILSVKFNSLLNKEELTTVYQEDLESFKNLPGLLQAYYMAEEITGAINSIYIFDTKEARQSFCISELARRTPHRYRMIPGTLRVEQYDMSSVLNDVLLC